RARRPRGAGHDAVDRGGRGQPRRRSDVPEHGAPRRDRAPERHHVAARAAPPSPALCDRASPRRQPSRGAVMRRWLPGVPAAVLLLVVSGCGSSSPKAAQAPAATDTPTSTTTAHASTQGVTIKLHTEPGVTPVELQRADTLIENT